MEPLEHAEEVVGIQRIETHAVVPDEIDGFSRIRDHAELDAGLGLFRGELPGVADQILEHLAQQTRIAVRLEPSAITMATARSGCAAA